MTHSDKHEWVMSVATLGEYRLPAMEELLKRAGPRLCVYAGVTPYEPTIRVLTSADLNMVELRNRYIGGDILLQNVAWRDCLRSECLLLDLNPRIIHVWVLLVARRLSRKRTILWGHAWPRGGRGSRSEKIRRAMRSLSSAIVTYTRTQAEELQREQPALSVFAAPNALYTRNEMCFERAGKRFRILCVGRLVDAKKPKLLLEAFELAAETLPEARLTFVGDGPLFLMLRKQAAASVFHERVEFVGHVADVARLRALYAEAVMSVSPGYVGLSATQSFGFGVPMLISEAEPHSPEIEAAIADENCVYFRTNDRTALCAAMVETWTTRDVWSARGPAIAAMCASNYSVERMVDGLLRAFTGLA